MLVPETFIVASDDFFTDCFSLTTVNTAEKEDAARFGSTTRVCVLLDC